MKLVIKELAEAVVIAIAVVVLVNICVRTVEADGLDASTPVEEIQAQTEAVFSAVFDVDDDTVPNDSDNCPATPNLDQSDVDADGVGDACNAAEDLDGDDWADKLDNCPEGPNPLQEDADEDGVGDDCDPFPEDPENSLRSCEAGLIEAEAAWRTCYHHPENCPIAPPAGPGR